VAQPAAIADQAQSLAAVKFGRALAPERIEGAIYDTAANEEQREY